MHWAAEATLPRYVTTANDATLLRREGENLTLLLAEKRDKARTLKQLGRLAGVTFNSA